MGSGKGGLWYYKESVNYLFQQSTTKKCLFKEDKSEGPIISIVYFRKIVVWSTPKMIRLRYYSSMDQPGKNICSIEIPARVGERFPEHLLGTQTILKPSILLMKSRQNIVDPNPNNVTLITSWFNSIRVNELVYEPESDKYFASPQGKKSIVLD